MSNTVINVPFAVSLVSPTNSILGRAEHPCNTIIVRCDEASPRLQAGSHARMCDQDRICTNNALDRKIGPPRWTAACGCEIQLPSVQTVAQDRKRARVGSRSCTDLGSRHIASRMPLHGCILHIAAAHASNRSQLRIVRSIAACDLIRSSQAPSRESASA